MGAIGISNELEKKILLGATQAITSVNNVDVGDEKLQLAILVETNTLANDIQHVVYELRKLLANHYGHITTNDEKLINSANSLAKVVNELQETLTTNVNNAKTQLKTQLAKLPQEADSLSNFINNSSDESDNTKVLHILNTFLTGVSKIETRNTLEKKSRAEIQATLDGNKHRKITALRDSHGYGKRTYDDLIHVARRGVEEMNTVAQALDDDAESFEGHPRNILHQVAGNLASALNTLKIAIHVSPDAFILKESMLVCAHIVYNEFQTLLNLLDDACNDMDICIRLHNTILSAVTDTMGCDDEYIQGLENIAAEHK